MNILSSKQIKKSIDCFKSQRHYITKVYFNIRISRHNIPWDAIFSSVAQSAALCHFKESRFLLPGTDRRPADVLIPHWAGGKDAALDVTVINPLQVATVAEAAVSPGLHTPGSGVVGSMAWGGSGGGEEAGGSPGTSHGAGREWGN